MHIRPISISVHACTKEFQRALLATQFPSPLLDVDGFTNQLVWPDTLHIAFRGFAPNFAASCLQDFFSKNKLDRAFDLLKAWATAHDVQICMDEIVMGDDGGFPTLNAKGFDIKHVCIFLAPGPATINGQPYLLYSRRPHLSSG